MNNLRKALDQIIGLYIADFEEKHDCYLEYWVADDTTGIAAIGDCFFNLSDIVYDIDNNCPAGKIFEWHNHEVEKAFTGKEYENVNFKSYLMGAR
jgi:hypothetical protein